jgi:hypothetical protein
MGQRGRLHVAEHFSRDVLAARYLEILGRVADPAPPRPLRAAVRPA